MDGIANSLVDTDKISLELSIRIGRTNLTVAELAALDTESVLTLDSDLTDEVELCVGDHVVATGELVAGEDSDQKLMLRITGAHDNSK